MSSASNGGSSGGSLGGCLLLLIPVLWIGSCVFTGSEKSNPPDAIASPASSRVSGPSSTGSNLLEQAILDAFPETAPATNEARRTASKASDFVGAAINSAGHLCAHPVEAERVAVGQYGIGCIRERSGGERVNYIIDVRTGSVSEI